MSYPSIRNLVDGNLEALIILGTLLIIQGYKQDRPLLLALGVLLAPTKPQTALLLLLVAGLYTLLSKPPRFWLLTAAYVLPVVVVTMLWRGPQWLDLLFRIPDQGSLMDISLVAALARAAIFPEIVNRALWGIVLVLTALVVWFSQREISREKAGLLIAASLLVAPYAGSSLSLVAVGLIPLFQKRRWLGGILIALNWLLLFFNRPEYVNVLAYYSTGVLLLSWLALLWTVWQDEIRSRQEVPKL
jgi:hypothetical protein